MNVRHSPAEITTATVDEPGKNEQPGTDAELDSIDRKDLYIMCKIETDSGEYEDSLLSMFDYNLFCEQQ